MFINFFNYIYLLREIIYRKLIFLEKIAVENCFLEILSYNRFKYCWCFFSKFNNPFQAMPVDRINLWTLIGGTLITERQLPLFSVLFFIHKKKFIFVCVIIVIFYFNLKWRPMSLLCSLYRCLFW